MTIITKEKIGIIITKHFHKHRKHITDHVIRHHKKYIRGLGAASGIATFKIFVLVLGIGLGLNPQSVYGDSKPTYIPATNNSISLLEGRKPPGTTVTNQ